MTGYHVSDVLWERIKPLIQKHVNHHPRGGGRKRVDDHIVFNAILFVARTGCQWKALDATGICSGSTAHLRFQEWTRADSIHEPDCVSPAFPFENLAKRISQNTLKKTTFFS